MISIRLDKLRIENRIMERNSMATILKGLQQKLRSKRMSEKWEDWKTKTIRAIF